MTPGFFKQLSGRPPDVVASWLASVTTGKVRRLLDGLRVHPKDAPVLFSKAAQPHLEEMAVRARAITQARFGRTMTLFAPLYLSNHCVNRCAYCGFAAHRSVVRSRLTLNQAVSQAEWLLERGIRHLLLVTGEAPEVFGLKELCEVAKQLRPLFASLSVEVFPCDSKGYQRLVRAGVDGLVLYQEVYQPKLYCQQHLAGPKRNFRSRLDAIEAGGTAGFRSLGIGTLLGLAPARLEACYLAWHGEYLTRRFPEVRLAFSFPRLRPVTGGTPMLHPVSDADLVQFIVGMRLMFPDAELVLSTREPARLRDHLFQLGITRVSAGSRTAPGGYDSENPGTKASQFEVHDRRSVDQVVHSVRKAGLDAVFKDFDPALILSGDAR